MKNLNEKIELNKKTTVEQIPVIKDGGSTVTVYRQGTERKICINNGSSDAEGVIATLDSQDAPPQYIMFPVTYRGQDGDYFCSINPDTYQLKIFKGANIAQTNVGKYINGNASWYVM